MTGLEIPGTTLGTPTFRLQGSQKKRKRKGMRKYLRRLQSKNILAWERKEPSGPGSPEIPIWDKLKEKQAKMHINQTNEN